MTDRFKFRAYDERYKRFLYRNLIDSKEATLDWEQCTGLKDKNGKLIYEWDIVVKTDTSAIGLIRQRTCRVFWNNNWLSWSIETEYGDVYMLSDYACSQYEIIGNIHENPELLEEKAE